LQQSFNKLSTIV